MVSLLLVLALSAPRAEDGIDKTNQPSYDNTYAKDFICDAPWRVVDENHAIPLTVILKDCDTDDIRELHWIRAVDISGGGSVTLWDHDFNDEEIGDDAPEHNYWTWITTVTEGHPSLPDGTPLTPANLGYSPGDAIEIEISIYYKDDWFNYTDGRTVRVHVGSGPFPWPEDWYGGDAHYHTMYTNNLYEFGAPLPAVRLTGIALGLHWLTTTDHSCDLDETGDGAFSYATAEWEYTIQSESGIATVYRNNNDYGSTWGALGADVDLLDGPDFRLFRGVEINLSSIDSDSWEKTLHTLFYNPGYISSPHSGAVGERPVSPSVPDGLDMLDATGFAYAAHPLYDLSGEWGGIDLAVNGAVWGDEDIETSLQREKFRGIQIFNTRITRESSDQNDPWADFDAGSLPDDPYPNELLAGIVLWDSYLVNDIASGSPRKIFIAGGSDAHGDFNYASYTGLDNYAYDNAIGKVQTVVRVPGAYGPPADLPPMSAIMDAFRAGESVVTDGPFLEIGVDGDGDGGWYGEEDVSIGGDGTFHPDDPLPLYMRWSSLSEFGPVRTVRLIAGDGLSTATLLSFDPDASGDGYGGTTSVDLSTFGLTGTHYFRCELLTDDGDAGHRAYTNPVWIDFDPTVRVASPGPPSPRAPTLHAAPNPFNPSTTITFTLSSERTVSLDILSPAGRTIRTLIGEERFSAGPHETIWDGRDDHGSNLPSGVYLCRIVAGEEKAVRKMVLLK